MRRSSGGEAPKACTDDMLETMLEVNAAWHTDDDSGVAGWPKQRGSQSHRAQQRVTDSQAAAAQVDDYALIDTADDTKHADGDKKLRYYHLRGLAACACWLLRLRPTGACCDRETTCLTSITFCSTSRGTQPAGTSAGIVLSVYYKVVFS